MAELKDLKIDEDAQVLISDEKMDSYEWDAITVKLFKDWKEKTNWIDVRDKLPIQGKEVLIADKSYNNYKGIGSYTLANGWAISGNNYWKSTHWIEIPELSIEDGQ